MCWGGVKFLNNSQVFSTFACESSIKREFLRRKTNNHKEDKTKQGLSPACVTSDYLALHTLPCV